MVQVVLMELQELQVSMEQVELPELLVPMVQVVLMELQELQVSMELMVRLELLHYGTF